MKHLGSNFDSAEWADSHGEWDSTLEEASPPRRKDTMTKQVDMTAIEDIFLARNLVDGIVVQRKFGKVYTNVPHNCVSHSPTGFEFGFEGSGPADLALNILEAVLKSIGHKGDRHECYAGSCFALAFRMHQDFKRAYIATLDQDQGGIISYEIVVAFIQVYLWQW